MQIVDCLRGHNPFGHPSWASALTNGTQDMAGRGEMKLCTMAPNHECIEDKGDMHVLPAPLRPLTKVLHDLQRNGIENPLPIKSQAESRELDKKGRIV
eukprot:s5266_g5.t2